MIDERINKFYVVTSGEYSDYSIVGIFDDKALAEAFMAPYPRTGRDDDLRLEEHPANPHEAQILEGLSFYCVEITKEGEIKAVELCAPDDDQEAHTRLRHPVGYIPWLMVYCWARDKDHAIKIAEEKRQEWNAKGAGWE